MRRCDGFLNSTSLWGGVRRGHLRQGRTLVTFDGRNITIECGIGTPAHAPLATIPNLVGRRGLMTEKTSQ